MKWFRNSPTCQKNELITPTRTSRRRMRSCSRRLSRSLRLTFPVVLSRPHIYTCARLFSTCSCRYQSSLALYFDVVVFAGTPDEKIDLYLPTIFPSWPWSGFQFRHLFLMTGASFSASASVANLIMTLRRWKYSNTSACLTRCVTAFQCRSCSRFHATSRWSNGPRASHSTAT